jgi:DUF1016 N-terminal domain/YhcG PDDEXK nuclease domain
MTGKAKKAKPVAVAPGSVPADPAFVQLHGQIRELLAAARQQVRRSVNDAMVQTYWHVGRLIVEGEQGGQARAAYGQRTLPLLAERLTAEFGKGFSAQSLWSFRQFHLEFPNLSTAWRELSWSHCRLLMRVPDAAARRWYADEAASQGCVFDGQMRQSGDNPTMGLILCSERNEAVARYSLLADSEQRFASRYRLWLPTEEELKAELERDRALIEAARAGEGGP